MPRRAKQASFVALNLRLPPDLHKNLVKAAGNTRSLNAEILGRLQRSFEPEEKRLLVRDRSKEAFLRNVIKKLSREAEELRNKSTEANALEALTRRVEELEERLRDQAR